MATSLTESTCYCGVCDECVDTLTKLATGQLKAKRNAQRNLAAEEWETPVIMRELDIYEPAWIIDSYLEVGAIGFLVGPFGSAKSFFALDWALCAATGRPWQEKEVTPTNVLYIGAEGGLGLGKRKLVWEHENQRVARNAAGFILKPVPLHHDPAIQFLCDTIKREEIGLIIIDTLARSIPGLDENTSLDMAKVIDSLYLLRDAWYESGTTVLVLHHTGKNEAMGPRGSSRLPSDVDFVYQVSKGDENNPFVLRCKKMKDDAQPEPFAFNLNLISIRNVRSCVIKATELPEETNVTPSHAKVLAALKTGGKTAAQIQKVTGLSHGSVVSALGSLTESADIQRSDTRPAIYSLLR